jgi:hypothetical protein
MLRFASWIEGGSGFVSVMHILLEGDAPPSAQQLRDNEAALELDIKTAGVKAFARGVFAYKTQSVLPVLLGAHGIGQVRANTVLVNRIDADSDSIEPRRRRDFGRQMRIALRSGCNVLVLDAEPTEIEALDDTPVNERRIDVWYRSDATGRLCLLLAYLTTRTADWKDAEIRLITDNNGRKGGAEAAEDSLRAMLDEVRIEATPHFVNDMQQETIIELSQESSLVFLPYTIRGGFATGPSGLSLADSGFGLQVVAFAMASQDLDLTADPEEGKVAELAAASDRAQKAKAQAKEAVKKAESAEKEAATLRKKLDATEPDADVLEADRNAQKARHAADRAVAKAEAAELAAGKTATNSAKETKHTEDQQ